MGGRQRYGREAALWEGGSAMGGPPLFNIKSETDECAAEDKVFDLTEN